MHRSCFSVNQNFLCPRFKWWCSLCYCCLLICGFAIVYLTDMQPITLMALKLAFEPWEMLGNIVEKYQFGKPLRAWLLPMMPLPSLRDQLLAAPDLPLRLGKLGKHNLCLRVLSADISPCERRLGAVFDPLFDQTIQPRLYIG